jgi:hypothetical protein
MSKRDRERRGDDLMDTDTWLGGQTSSGGSLCFKPPSKAPLFQPDKGGTYLLDVYPYRATEANPKSESHGKRVPDCMYFRHVGIGPNRDKVLCPGQTYRRKCYICDYRAKLGSNPDRDKDVEKQLADLMAKQRQIWNVFNHDEPKKGWQIFEISFHLFGKQIMERIANSRPKEMARYKTWWHPGEAGMTVEALATEKTNPGYPSFIDFGQITFRDRSSKLISRLDGLGDPFCLDKCLRETPYGEVKKIFLATGGADDEDEEDEDDTDDSDLDDEDEEDEDDAPKKKSKKSKKDEEEDDEEDEDNEDLDEEEDEDDDDEDEEEDDEDEVEYDKGDNVLAKMSNGKKRKGKILKVLDGKFKVKFKTGVEVVKAANVLGMLDDDEVPF